MSNDIKKLRGQIRQIVKELLPDVLSTELFIQLRDELNKKISERLDAVDKKQRDINSYVVRNHASNEPLLKPTK